MSIGSWADAARQGQYHQSAEHQRAIDTIQAVLEGILEPDSAACTIASAYEPLLKRGFKTSPVATLWGMICDVARSLGANREITERQIALLNSISELPDVLDGQGKAITPAWKSAGVYWRDLPELAMMFREYAIDIEPLDELDENQWDTQAEALLNATTFGAMYLVIGKQDIGMSFHAEISLMQGIEVPCQTLEQQRHALMFVPPAATWVLIAGKRIYELCKVDHNRQDGAPGSTPIADEWLWGKGRGYSLGRWGLWKSRFSEIATAQGLKDSVKEIAARASSEMDRVDAQI